MQQRNDDRSLGELLADLTNQMTTLVRQEVELARVETTAKVTRAARNAAMLAVGGVVVYTALLALVAAVILLLANAGIPGWLSALIVGVLLAIAGALLIQRGLAALRREDLTPKRTIETLKEDAELVRGRTK